MKLFAPPKKVLSLKQADFRDVFKKGHLECLYKITKCTIWWSEIFSNLALMWSHASQIYGILL